MHALAPIVLILGLEAAAVLPGLWYRRLMTKRGEG